MTSPTMSSKSKGKERPAQSHKRHKNKIEVRLLTKSERKLIASRLFQSMQRVQGTGLDGRTQKSRLASVLPDVSVRVTYSVPLKCSKCDKIASSTLIVAHPIVTFQETVSVIEIPSYRSYDSEVRKSIWGTRQHIRANAARNKAEFAADGRDWRTCKEEDEMLTLNGELVHPVTYLSLQRYNQRRLFRRLRDENLKESPMKISVEESALDRTLSTSRVTRDVTNTCVSRESLVCPGPPEAIRSPTVAGDELYLSSSVRLLPSHLLPPQSRSLLSTKAGKDELLKPKHIRRKDLKTLPVRSQISRKCITHKRDLLLRPAKRAVLLS